MIYINAECPDLFTTSLYDERLLSDQCETFGRYHGCNSAACVLCKHNPAKRCTGNFAHKYWVGDKLLAKCEGTIMVELIDAETGARMTDEVQGMKIEVRPCDDEVVFTEYVTCPIDKEET